MARELTFEDVAQSERDDDDPALIVDVDGFEGPLDLLLELARRQKVDLARISILALAEQYLGFVEEARRVRLELAADYLVMAAWLAYLKSRLLLPEAPKGEGDEPSAADLATALALRLKRLEAMREAAKKLAERPQLGREFFARGQPEAIGDIARPQWGATLYDLLSAYSRQRMKNANARVTLRKRFVWSLVDARETLERLVGVATNWTQLDDFLVDYAVDPAMRTTVRASAFSATLEMVREGLLDLQQDGAFTPLWVRKRGKARNATEAGIGTDVEGGSLRDKPGHEGRVAQDEVQEDAA
ncbi:Segregation and condensation protein A [Hyphomicrobiales bacterium]|nr:Segregation and condensation protein A [Hyphomicrobiales bacterium]CAH1665551.1 Segregation and condensation protein A [Hyphomicrobiales bacterium]